MRVVVISDVHGKHENVKIPPCELLISAGDYSMRGLPNEVESFHKWMNKQPADYMISVQGNHEMWVEKNFKEAEYIATTVCPKVYFMDEGPVEIGNVKVWCSAVTPLFCNWAWNRTRGSEIRRHWDRIPDDTQILITHGPPYGIGDTTPYGELAGCVDLLNRIGQLKALKVHAFGHLHSGAGIYKKENMNFINAAICNESYEPINKPTVIDL